MFWTYKEEKEAADLAMAVLRSPGVTGYPDDAGKLIVMVWQHLKRVADAARAEADERVRVAEAVGFREGVKFCQVRQTPSV